MKIILGAGVTVLAAAGGIAGGAIYLGNITHQRLDDATHKIAAQTSFMRVAKIEHIKRVLSSTRMTTLEFGCADARGKSPLSIVLKEDIRHGPLPMWNVVGAVIINSEIRPY
ncbi:MAG: DUF945 family protein [Burkholderiales bacterium]